MEIKARSVFDYKSIKAMTHAAMYRKYKPINYLIFMCISCILLIVSIILSMMHFGVDVTFSLLLIVSVYLLFLNCFRFFAIPKKQYKSLKNMQNTETEFTFYDDCIRTTTQNVNYSGQSETRYEAIPKVIETSEYLFIYQTQRHVFIVDKSTITNGTIDDIREKLIPIVKKKYITCKY